MADTQQGEFAIVLGARQVAVGLFMVVVLMGTFSAITYVIGRMMVPPPAEAVARKPADQVLVVDPVPAPAPAATARPAPAPAVTRAKKPAKRPAPAPVALVRPVKPAPRQAALPAAVPSTRAPYFQKPRPGQLYFQVAAVQQGVARVCVEYLRREHLPSRYTDGPDEQSYRVLVGPLVDHEQIVQLRARLASLGFQPFLRRYKRPPVHDQAMASLQPNSE